jgi:nucleoside-diphosphate-sugar epimerase
MRVLVAGGAGFIGSHVCEALLAQGHEVICLDNLSSGRFDNIAELDDRASFTFIREDVTRTPLLDVDLVLHLASPASPVHYAQHPVETMMANSAGTHRLLALAADCGARFVFASTSEVYGDPLQHPQDESYWGNVDPVGPRACYDESKRFGEALTWSYRRKHGVNASIVRVFNTYGPRMDAGDGRVVPAFIEAALDGRPIPVHGDGSQTRSFCYVSDLVAGLLLVAFDERADGHIFNIGNPEEVTMLDLARAVSEAAGAPCRIEHLPAQPGDPARRRPDITRMQNRYGWTPRIALRDGLARCIDNVRRQRPAREVARAA